MLVQDVALEHLHVVLGVDRCGLVGADGETHHGCIDYLSQIPGMTVYAPASFAELRRMLRRAVLEEKGPVAVRYPRGGECGYHGDCGGERDGIRRRRGSRGDIRHPDRAGAGGGGAAEKRGYFSPRGKAEPVAPLDGEAVCAALDGASHIVAVEDQLRAGCVGERLAAVLAERGIPTRLLLRNVGDALPPQGTVSSYGNRWDWMPRASPRRSGRYWHEQKNTAGRAVDGTRALREPPKAQATIMAGLVFVEGQRSDKPGTPVAEDAAVEVRGHALRYVSRGGLKLEKAMLTFPSRSTG